VVQVNQTFTGRTGVTITIQQATKWLPATQFWANTGGWHRMAGLRVIVDDRQAKAAGMKLDDWPPPGDPVPLIFTLVTPDFHHSAFCYGLYENSDAAGRAQDLAAFGGDVAFSFDEPTGVGEGWIVCGTLSTEDAF